jgi:catechol 2,3-dioxygenase-like lactoylglutathione lyase family enzyme
VIKQLDHLVMTVTDMEKTCAFYSDVLKLKVVTFGDNRRALQIGKQKINLHPINNTYAPTAEHATAGSNDLCFIVSISMLDLIEMLTKQNIEIITGPIQRTGATTLLNSIYIRDPDGNLLELSTPIVKFD